MISVVLFNLNAMNNCNLDTTSVHLLQSQAELQGWEIANFPILSSLSGRQLYYGLIKHYLLENEQEVKTDSLKNLYFGDGIGLTDRALRTKLREFENAGFVVSVPCESDKRSRSLLITESFLEKMNTHAIAYQRILRKKFFIMEN
jgi:hypothetical protein